VKHPSLTIPLSPEPKPEDVETFTLLLRRNGVPAAKVLKFGSTTADIESLMVPGIGLSRTEIRGDKRLWFQQGRKFVYAFDGYCLTYDDRQP
jgi:hypothetical protein